MLSMKPDLKNCPFCGQEPYFREFNNQHMGNGEFSTSYEVGCSKCEYSMRRISRLVIENGTPKYIKNGFEEIVSLWNSRADDNESDETQSDTQDDSTQINDD